MNTKYDYEWVKQDILDSTIINMFDSKGNAISCFQAYDIINSVGEDITIRQANINDLSSLLEYGTVKFIDSLSSDWLNIPFKYIYKLYEEPNYLLIDELKVENKNKKISMSEVDGYGNIKGNYVTDNYLIATCIKKVSNDLIRIMEIAKSYDSMSMNEKFDALSEVNLINYRREKENNI